jgi:hypothetical protein
MSSTLASVALEVVVGAGGADAGAPLIGTSPARTVIDISPVRAIANTKAFHLESPLRCKRSEDDRN